MIRFNLNGSWFSTVARFWLCAIALLATVVSAGAVPRVATRAAPECAGARCTLAPWSDRTAGDPALLTIDGLGSKPIRHYYASDDGARAATFVTDATGCNYVLLEYAVGRGTGAGKVVYLAVLHVTDRATLLRKVRLRYWLSPANTAEYRYNVDKPFGGGLTVALTRRFTGKQADWRYPPPTQVVSIPPPD
jgi:hypothetical protein